MAASASVSPASASVSIKKCWNPTCVTESSATKKCGKCKEAIYCEQECQRAHWESTHRVTCISAQAPRPAPAAAAPQAPRPSPARAAAAPAAAAPQAKIPDEAGFNRFVQMCVSDGSPMALSEARKYAALGQMREAADFVSLMVPPDQETFLKEMANNPAWKTVQVAVTLAKSKRMKEAMGIMEGLPADRPLFMQAIGSTREQFLGRYKTVIRL